MTAAIFTLWLKDWDKELGKQSRKIVLIVDNAGLHPHLIGLKNITLEFLPQILLLSFNHSIWGSLQHTAVTYILKAIKDNLVTLSTCAIDISSKINILQAIRFVADIWRKVLSITIHNYFAHCGFRPLIDLPIPLFVFIVKNIAQFVGNGELFLKIDDGMQCFNENENHDNILNEIAERSRQNKESDDNDDVQLVKIITREAEKCIDR
jgi:hypothetical protein